MSLPLPSRVNHALRDHTGRYKLAVEHLVLDAARRREWERVEALAKYVASPLGAYRPLPKARQFHQSGARYRWALGGNRSSKSHGLAVETVWLATGLHPWRRVERPTYGWYATTTWDEVGKTLYKEKLQQLLKGIDHEVIWHNKQREIPYEIRIPRPGFVDPSIIAFKAYEQGRRIFQAASLDYAHFDEQFPHDIFIETITRIGPGSDMQFSAAMTPIESQPWLEDKLNGATLPPGYAVFEYPLDDNRISTGGFISDERIDALIDEWPPEVRETRRLGKWGSYLGSIFQTFNRDIHVVDEKREAEIFLKGPRKPGQLPYPLRCVGTIDWGGSNPFVFLWAVKIPHLDDDWYVFDELYWDFKIRGQRRLDQFAEDIKARTLAWGTVLDRTWADHDPTNAAMFASYGISTRPANKDVLLGIETVQGYLNPREHLIDANFPKGRPRLHIALRCKNFLKELPGYKWAEGTERRDARNEPQKKDDHSVDAGRYLLHSEAAYEHVGTTRKTVDLGKGNRRKF